MRFVGLMLDVDRLFLSFLSLAYFFPLYLNRILVLRISVSKKIFRGISQTRSRGSARRDEQRKKFGAPNCEHHF